MVVILGLVLVATLALTPAASAKTYNDFAGHPAVQYEHSDITSALKPYVDHVEYDTVYDRGYGYGCRLYLTEEGARAIRNGDVSLLRSITYSVMAAPEWKQERTFYSVKEEIWFHSWIGKTVSGIEYYYQDLKPHEYWKYM